MIWWSWRRSRCGATGTRQSRMLDAGLAVIDKERRGNDDAAEAVNVIGDVNGRTTLIVEDEIATGGTIIAAAEALQERGAATFTLVSRTRCCRATRPAVWLTAR